MLVGTVNMYVHTYLMPNCSDINVNLWIFELHIKSSAPNLIK